MLFLLRLAPINPSLVSYVLGTTGVRFHAFLAACVGLLPAYFVAVYLGYAAKHATKLAGHVSEHSTAHHIATFTGLALSIVLLLGLAHYARKAIQEATAPSLAPQSG